MNREKAKAKRLQRRKWRVRKKVFGTAERPRLSVFRSDKHITCQIINDYEGRTLVSATSVDKETRGDLPNGGNIAAAKIIGRVIAERALAAGITQVAFDRGGRLYHGRVKAVAEAAREAGLKF